MGDRHSGLCGPTEPEPSMNRENQEQMFALGKLNSRDISMAAASQDHSVLRLAAQPYTDANFLWSLFFS